MSGRPTIRDPARLFTRGWAAYNAPGRGGRMRKDADARHTASCSIIARQESANFNLPTKCYR